MYCVPEYTKYMQVQMEARIGHRIPATGTESCELPDIGTRTELRSSAKAARAQPLSHIINPYFFKNVNYVHLCVKMYVCECKCLWNPEKGTGCPGGEVTSGFKLSGMSQVLYKSSA